MGELEIKVLLVSSTDFRGGPKIYAGMLTKGLLSMDVDVFTETISPVTGKYVWDKVKLYKKLGESVSKKYSGKVDLVHSLGSSFFLMAPLEISKRLELPFIISIHGLMGDELLFAKGRTFRNYYRVKIIEHYEKKCFKEADLLITFSNLEKESIQQKYGNLPVKVIYHGSDHVPNIPLPKKREGVCYVKPTPQKGFIFFKRIAFQMPNVRFAVFGTAEKKKITLKNIIYHPYMNQREFFSQVSKSSLLIHPSKHDSFCITILEAMRLGIIPIVSEYTGIKEIMNGIGEVLPLDIQKWTESVAHLYRSVTEEDRKKAIFTANKYTWKKSAEKHLEMYQRLAASK